MNSGSRASLRTLIERRLHRPYIEFVCLLVLSVYLVAFVGSFVTNAGGRTIFGPHLGADFGAFYVAGTIFNTHSPERIYDPRLHQRLYQAQFPEAPPDSQLPYVNAPFFILPFTVLARLPYSWAYLSWFVLSLGLYVAGFFLLWERLDGIPREARQLALLLALSFMPFLVECLAGGQTTAVGFFCLALAISSEQRGRYFLSGLAVSVCSYKPTLLLLIVPMLVVRRRYRTLLGLGAGCAALSLLSLVLVGWQGCLGYVDTLLYFTNASTSVVSGLRSWKYVDINSFFRLLLGQAPLLRWIMTGATFLLVLPFLLRAWWQSDLKRGDGRSLAWALALSWTLVLNLYVGIYDSALVVLSVLSTAAVLVRRRDDRQLWLPATFKLILFLLYVVPWMTQPIARVTGIQLYTLTLALFGAWQIMMFQDCCRRDVNWTRTWNFVLRT